MKIKPKGYFVLVEIEPVEETYANSSIVMPETYHKKEVGGRDIGTIISFGPTAFKGFEGCDSPEDWGVKVGDKVEFNRYDGKTPRIGEIDQELANMRIIRDSDIIAGLESDE